MLTNTTEDVTLSLVSVNNALVMIIVMNMDIQFVKEQLEDVVVV